MAVCFLGSAASGCAYTESGFSDLLDEQTLGGLGFSRTGYSETPLANDAYRIHAFGNKNATHQKTAAVALVRAAALAKEHGYDRFVIIDYDEWTDTSYRRTPTTATTDTTTTATFNANGTAYDVGSYRYADVYRRAKAQSSSTTEIHHGRTYAIDKPKTDIVVMFVPVDAPEAARALHADGVIARYGKMAGYKAEETPRPIEAAATYAQPSSGYAASPELDRGAVKATPLRAIAPTQVSTNHDLPTLDEVYRSLSANEKARVNRLPPAQRANYLEEIRAGRP